MSTRTACPYCGVGCGVEASGERAALNVSGDAGHPANQGRLCSKGAALGETVRLDGRLLHPMVDGKRKTWRYATRYVARRLRDVIAAHGPDSVAFYVSGQLLTEDYYVANKLMKGFIGSANIDTNSRLCMASAVTAHKLAFGEDVVPACYDDLDLADLVIFAGHNAAWTHPVLYRRMEAAQARGQRHIVIDPRETDTAGGAFLHLKLKAQTDVRLWNGLLAHLWRTGAVDARFVEQRTTGLHEVLSALKADDQSVAAIAADCGLEASDVLAFYQAFAKTERTVTLFSQGVNQSVDGVAKCSAIINAHLLTGRISKPGASPFSITGQPNAMGGRETGGMANTLAAHMDFTPDDIDRVRRFWNAPRVATKPGLKAVDLFDAVAEGRIKALWIMATNPAVSMPDAARVRAALARCPLVIVSDVIAATDTARYAHVRLPALAWGEKEGTVTNSERCISRQRALMAPPGSARADWRIISEVAAAMGFADAFRYRSPADVFREYAALTGFENDGARILDIGALATLADSAYAALEPIRWPIGAGGGTDRPLAQAPFPTPDGRARFVRAESRPRRNEPSLPLALNTGRIRDQWHTMTRTGLAPRLMQHAPEPYIEIHPDDAATAGVADGALVHVRTIHGEATLTARLSTAVRVGEVFAPMHWTDEFAPHGRVNGLVNPDADARSGQPEFKRTPASVAPALVAWRAFFITRTRRDPSQAVWWRRIPCAHGQLYEIAAGRAAPSPRQVADALFAGADPEDMLSASDGGAFLRQAALRGGRVERVFYASATRGLPSRDWLIAILGADALTAEDRRRLLAGGAGAQPRGAAVCACFAVTRGEIETLCAAEPGVTAPRVAA
ncbi:MAG: nitrate reductase, partial [Hydrogenophilaceae bacterium]|nr:nitrate reductase [Hydrogenophilaceae bacterium]